MEEGNDLYSRGNVARCPHKKALLKMRRAGEGSDSREA
jgi:hypothetical protein